MRKYIDYDNRRFWQVTDRSALRHAEPYQLEVLNWEPGGEVQYRCRPVTPLLYKEVKLKVEGIV